MSTHLKDKHEALAFKRSVERSFEQASGLPDRRHYSAFYALPQESPILWLNLNPGGTVENHQILSDEQLLAGEHEFFDGHGKTSVATGSFLRALFPRASERQLRAIQGSNVAWQRSNEGRDINLKQAAHKAAPFLHQLILSSKPTHIIFGGAQARELYLEHGGAKSRGVSKTLLGNWGRAQARIFIAEDLSVDGLGTIRSITISHPSRGTRKTAFDAASEEVIGTHLPESIAYS